MFTFIPMLAASLMPNQESVTLSAIGMSDLVSAFEMVKIEKSSRVHI